MILHVYEWERYERSTVWRIIAAIFLVGLFRMTMYRWDYWWWALLILFVGLYAWYEWHTRNDIYRMSFEENGLSVWKKLRFWHQLQWFSLWFKKESEIVECIYLYTTNDVLVYTIDDPQEDIDAFVEKLADQIPYFKQVRLSTVKKIMRRLKI